MEWTVAIGVDTHCDLHVAVAVDQLGRRLGSLELSVDEDGFAELVVFACSMGRPAFVIERTGSYGASLARLLLAQGYQVFECERPNRRARKDKTTCSTPSGPPGGCSQTSRSRHPGPAPSVTIYGCCCLNRGGDRQLNWALHITALTRISSHPETRAYYQRLQTAGKTKREAIRIIKRALARRLYSTLAAAT